MQATETDWQERVVALKAEGKESAEIAEAVGKSASTVRKVLARAREAGAPDEASTNGNGHHDVPPEDDPEYERDALAEFREEAGEAVGPMPPTPPEREMDGGETVHVDEILVGGTAQLDLFSAGGRAPDSASLRLAGGKVGIVFGEAFSKGDVIHFSGTAVVTAVKQQDKRDGKTGTVVGCEQQHTALITDLTVG